MIVLFSCSLARGSRVSDDPFSGSLYSHYSSSFPWSKNILRKITICGGLALDKWRNPHVEYANQRTKLTKWPFSRAKCQFTRGYPNLKVKFLFFFFWKFKKKIKKKPDEFPKNPKQKSTCSSHGFSPNWPRCFPYEFPGLGAVLIMAVIAWSFQEDRGGRPWLFFWPEADRETGRNCKIYIVYMDY